jgi:two-component system response regulator MprA
VGGEKRLVLVAEDAEEVRLAMRLVLERAGLSVVEAADGTEAVRLVDELKPALVVLDVKLPGLSGFDVARRIREREGTRTPIMIVTAHVDRATEEEAAGAGADAYFSKPFSADEFLATANSLLAAQPS